MYFEFPVSEPAPEEASAYRALYADLRVRRDGDVADYTLPYPKHRFLDFLVDQGLLLHGSPRARLSELDGVRKSKEARGGFGARPGTYAASDGVWPMWFAILRRRAEWWRTRKWRPYMRDPLRRLVFEAAALGPRSVKSSICPRFGTSNIVKRAHDEQGRERRFARFSVGDWYWEVNGFGSGVVYALNRDGFEKDAGSEQWVSTSPARVLFGLAVTPQDFPCMDQVATHTAGEFRKDARLNEFTERVMRHVDRIERAGGACRITFARSDDVTHGLQAVARHIAGQLPGEVNVLVDESAGGVPTVTIEGPEWVREMMVALVRSWSS